MNTYLCVYSINYRAYKRNKETFYWHSSCLNKNVLRYIPIPRLIINQLKNMDIILLIKYFLNICSIYKKILTLYLLYLCIASTFSLASCASQNKCDSSTYVLRFTCSSVYSLFWVWHFATDIEQLCNRFIWLFSFQ